MTPAASRMHLAALRLSLLALAAPAFADLKLDGVTLDTPKHRVTLDPTGLPAQLVIKAAPEDLPLPFRPPNTPPGDADLLAVGRGPQLRAPARLEATIDGKVTVAQPAQPLQTAAETGRVTCAGTWQAGALRGALRIQYDDAGAIAAELTYGGQDVLVDRLELVLDLAGPFDTVVAGPPVAAQATAYPPGARELGPDEGIAWKNVPDNADARQPAYPGVLSHCFLGSGDRGFTWLADDAAGFAVDDRLPTALVERDKAGLIRWRLALVNTPTKANAPRTARFALLVHPARDKAAGRRQAQWKPWPGEPLAPALAWTARKPGLDMVRADCATVHEACAARALLAGPAGGDALSAALTLADTYPTALFRYLAAPHTGLGVQLRTNAARLANPGASPACDRVALGRALLHDIGADVTGLAQRAGAANILRALDAFGFFKDDGKMEFLPYWRSAGAVRFGETFVPGGTFEVTTENPTARAHVSVYLRPTDKTPAKVQALFVVANEGAEPLREQFYLLQPQRLFGGPNALTAATIVNNWDFRAIPQDSDWRKSVLVKTAADRQKPGLFLADVEDDGFMQATSTGGGMEIYGKLFVPARGFRLLLGTGAP